MSAQPEELGCREAQNDLNEDSPPQAQQHHPEDESGEESATGDTFTEQTRQETETGPGHEAD